MPELPEIETVKLQLARVLVGRILEGYAIYRPKSVQGDLDKFKGRRVVGVRRLAKVLLIEFSGDLTLAFHFKMTGQLVFERIGFNPIRVVGGHPTEDFVGKLPSSHTRVVFIFNGGTLYFNDQRLFGWIKAGPRVEIEAEKFLAKLGPEPFDITNAEFVRRVSRSKRPIKLVLMDQEVISGVGNIYANDALWEARVNPRASASSLSVNQLASLFEKVKLVLREGIKYGGATAADAKYIDLHGLGGHYQEHFRVYDRTGLPCHRCGTKISKTVLSGRGTYYCPQCQKK